MAVAYPLIPTVNSIDIHSHNSNILEVIRNNKSLNWYCQLPQAHEDRPRELHNPLFWQRYNGGAETTQAD